MNFLDVTFQRVLAIWWSLVWRCVVFTMLLGAFLGLAGGIVVSAVGHRELGAVGAPLTWLLASILVSIAALRRVLGKEFKGFSVKLVRTDGAKSAQSDEWTFEE